MLGRQSGAAPPRLHAPGYPAKRTSGPRVLPRTAATGVRRPGRHAAPSRRCGSAGASISMPDGSPSGTGAAVPPCRPHRDPTLQGARVGTVLGVDRLHGLEVPSTLAEVCRPDRLALLVYDMQEGILDQIEDRERVITRVRRVLEIVRDAGVRTFFTRHVTLPVELWAPPSCACGAHGSVLIALLDGAQRAVCEAFAPRERLIRASVEERNADAGREASRGRSGCRPGRGGGAAGLGTARRKTRSPRHRRARMRPL